MIGLNIFIAAALVLLILPFMLCGIDRWRGTTYSCRWFGWHNGEGSGEHTFDGCSFGSTCGKCGKRVLLDSQGNWFEASR